jgi:hypothetical protein
MYYLEEAGKETICANFVAVMRVLHTYFSLVHLLGISGTSQLVPLGFDINQNQCNTCLGAGSGVFL